MTIVVGGMYYNCKFFATWNCLDFELKNYITNFDEIPTFYFEVNFYYRTASRASIIASSDHGVGFERDNSMPSRLQRPYRVPIQLKMFINFS